MGHAAGQLAESIKFACMDEALFAKWIDGVYEGQLNTQVGVLLREMLGTSAPRSGCSPGSGRTEAG